MLTFRLQNYKLIPPLSRYSVIADVIKNCAQKVKLVLLQRGSKEPSYTLNYNIDRESTERESTIRVNKGASLLVDLLYVYKLRSSVYWLNAHLMHDDGQLPNENIRNQ